MVIQYLQGPGGGQHLEPEEMDLHDPQAVAVVTVPNFSFVLMTQDPQVSWKQHATCNNSGSEDSCLGHL